MSFEEMIPKDIKHVLEEHFRMLGHEESLGEHCFEFGGWTPAGGEMIHDLYVKDDALTTTKAWALAFQEMVCDFDPWEEAHKFLDVNGDPVPGDTPFDNGLELYEDIVAYKEGTLEVANQELGEASINSRRGEE